MVARPRKSSSIVERSAALALRDGGLRLAIVADTHSAPHENTAKLLRAAAPDAILHGGDIGDLAVLGELAAIAPTLAVRGNIDGVANDLPDELVIDVRDEARGESLFRIFLVHIAVYGPKLRAEVARRARAKGAAIVVCGHSHVPFIGRDQGLTVFNPGSVGPRRFHLPIVFGLLELKGGKVDLAHVSCETGERWLPP
jgi:putative phosphoesterase